MFSSVSRVTEARPGRHHSSRIARKGPRDLRNMARELTETETELETIAGGGFWGSVVNFFHNLFAGPGDLRRPLNRP